LAGGNVKVKPVVVPKLMSLIAATTFWLVEASVGHTVVMLEVAV
jgi:hypothetical protein